MCPCRTKPHSHFFLFCAEGVKLIKRPSTIAVKSNFANMALPNRSHKRCLAIVVLLPMALCFTSKSIALGNVQNSRNGQVDRTHVVAVATHATARHVNLGRSNLYTRYMDLLERQPFLTQSISAGIISALGDVLSQWIELKHISFSLNWVRLITFLVCGTLYVGPFVHLWYKKLWKMGRWMEGKYQTSKQIQTLSQVIVDQTVGVAFFFPTYFYAYEYMEALISWRGTSVMLCTSAWGPRCCLFSFLLSLPIFLVIAPNLAATHSMCWTELASVLIMQYRIWPITNWVIFAHVPENLRVLASNFVAVAWNAYLCARVA